MTTTAATFSEESADSASLVRPSADGWEVAKGRARPWLALLLRVLGIAVIIYFIPE